MPTIMEPANCEDDKHDMAELAAGKDSAMNRIMHRWQDRLLAFLTRMVGNPATACDLTQETFVRLYRHRASYNPRLSFSTWIFTIAANIARNHHRWNKRHPETLADPADTPQNATPSHEADPHQRAVAREQLEAVRHAIAKLPQNLRETLILSVYEQLSHEEIADITDSTVKAVELRLYRARQTLRSSLATYLECSD